MSVADSATEVALWITPDQQTMWEKLSRRTGAAVRLVALGGPRASELSLLAGPAESRPCDDFRQMMTDFPADILLLGTTEGIDPSDLGAVIDQETQLLFIEPPVDDFEDLHVFLGSRGRNRTKAGQGSRPVTEPLIVLEGLPSFLNSRGWIGATDPMQAIGEPGLIELAFFRRPNEQSLFSCLFDAWRTAIELTQMPSEIWAIYRHSGHERSAGTEALTLRRLTGHLGALGTLPRQGILNLQISDQHPAGWGRMHLIGDTGSVMVGEQDYRLWDKSGQVLDQRRPTPRPAFDDLIIQQWRDRMGRQLRSAQTREAALTRYREVLSCCHATLLSIRTRQPESPAKFMQIPG